MTSSSTIHYFLPRSTGKNWRILS